MKRGNGSPPFTYFSSISWMNCVARNWSGMFMLNIGYSRDVLRYRGSGMDRKSSGTLRFEALDSEHVKGTVKMTMTSDSGNTDINSSFTAKLIGETCSSDK